MFASLVCGVLLAWRRIDHYRKQSRLKDDMPEDKKLTSIQELARSEMTNRRLLKYQGSALLFASLFLAILTIVRFLNK